jgi:large subunit ribosomal protein L18
MATKNTKTEKRLRLKKKIRAKISGTSAAPRLSVFRSNTYIYAQLIDDTTGTTLASASDVKMTKGTKGERAKEVGKLLAAGAKAKGITKVIFDRNGFKYTGRIEALADEARAGGLQF